VAARTLSYRAVVTADREREREILAQETEKELIDTVEELGGYPAENAADIIATVRAHDRAKGEQYAEPRPVSGWTEEELLDKVDSQIMQRDSADDIIATVRAHDRAKGQRYPEPRPVSEWTEEMGACLFWEPVSRCWEISGSSGYDPDYTHFFPLPKEPK
jgi:hypothetical protein